MRSFIPALVLVVVQQVSAAGADVRELYAVGHFGNWYEVAGEREMRAVLAEAKAWGFNRYGDWFDMLDCVDPFADDGQYDLGNALWDRKRANFRVAQSLGLETDLVFCPNHVYRDQLRPEWLAKRGPRIQGQLICPSKPDARAAILENCRGLLAGLAGAGVRLKAINLAPYDYGGCACDACKPWILTFARLSIEIHDIARQYHPGVELDFIGWWWTADEHRQFAEWMDVNAPGRAASIFMHIPYGQTRVADVPLPKGCLRRAFVHIGYPDQPKPRDQYGLTGPLCAPVRLERTVRDLKQQGVAAFMAYSEGIHDDVNKALLGGLWTGRYATLPEVLSAYAKRYFNADDRQAQDWAQWLAAWGRPFEVDTAAARKTLAELPGDSRDWRRRQWELKTELFAAHQAIGDAGEWTPERLARVEAFWAVYEELQRRVYGLGPQRHIFAPQFVGLSWYRSWADHQKITATRPMDPEQ